MGAIQIEPACRPRHGVGCVPRWRLGGARAAAGARLAAPRRPYGRNGRANRRDGATEGRNERPQPLQQKPSQPPAASVAWLADWALYAALKQRFGGRSWLGWDEPVRRRQPARARRRAARAGGRDRVPELRAVSVLPPVDRAARSGRRARRPRSSETCRSTSPLDSADVWAHRGAVPARTRRAARARSPACRPTTSRRPASAGEIRSTDGTRLADARLRLVDRARRPPAPARARAAPRSFPRLRLLLGGAGEGRDRREGTLGPRARPAALRRPRRGARRPAVSSPRTSARSTRACTRCGASSACPGCESCSSAIADRGQSPRAAPRARRRRRLHRHPRQRHLEGLARERQRR